jgi:hypothetical protein
MTSTTRSITRRSGGLPMLISAVLVAEADVQSFELTKLALSQLLALAETPLDMSGTQGTEPAKWDLPQVHAQNAMRAIFMEPKLAPTTFGYVESAFAIAIKGFSSDVCASFSGQINLVILFEIAVSCYSILYYFEQWDKNMRDKISIHPHRIDLFQVRFSSQNFRNYTNIFWMNSLLMSYYSRTTRYHFFSHQS